MSKRTRTPKKKPSLKTQRCQALKRVKSFFEWYELSGVEDMDEVVGEYPKKACQVKNAFDNGDMFVATPMGGRAAGLFITPFINESTLHEMLDLGVISEDEFRNWNDAEVGIVVGKGMRILNDREWDLPHNVCLDK